MFIRTATRTQEQSHEFDSFHGPIKLDQVAWEFLKRILRSKATGEISTNKTFDRRQQQWSLCTAFELILAYCHSYPTPKKWSGCYESKWWRAIYGKRCETPLENAQEKVSSLTEAFRKLFKKFWNSSCTRERSGYRSLYWNEETWKMTKRPFFWAEIPNGRKKSLINSDYWLGSRPGIVFHTFGFSASLNSVL